MKRLTILLVLVLVGLAACSGTTDADLEVPADVQALIDEWWAANGRGDGSVVDLYTPDGKHLYGTTVIRGDDLVDHFSRGGEPEWARDPVLIVDEGDGRYVVTGGLDTGFGVSAFTFEIVTTADGLRIRQTTWLYI